MARSFKEYISNAGSRQGCPRCGNPTKDGAVTVRLMKFKDDNPSRFDQVSSRQVSMCESCTVEVFDELVSTLDGEANGGSRPPRSSGATPTPAPRRTASTRRRRTARS